MKATLVADETYDIPPRLGSGVLVGIKGVVHVVRRSHGIRVLMFCADDDEASGAWKQYKTLEQGWFEVPTCVRCAVHPGATRARYYELKWRVEWWDRASNRRAAPLEVEPTL